MSKIKYENKIYNSLFQACKENGFSYDGCSEYKRKKNVSAQEAFDYYVENRPAAKKPYTDDELSLMREIADAGFSSTMAAEVLGRPIKSIKKKSQQCGIHFHSVRKFTKEDLEWFSENFKNHTYEYIAKELSCDVRALQYRGKRLGLTKSRETERLTFIRKNAGKLSTREISKALDISERAVATIACENKISLACPEKSGRRPWTEQEDDILREYAEKEGYKAIAKRLGTRTPGTVWTRLRVLGLR